MPPARKPSRRPGRDRIASLLRLLAPATTVRHLRWFFLCNGETLKMGVAPEIVSSCALKMDREESILSFEKTSALFS